MKCPDKLWILLFSCLGIFSRGEAQSCNLPVLTSFTDASTEGFTIAWDNNNANVLYYEIEFGPKGFQRNFQADISGIQDRFYAFTGLEPGSSWEIYLRTVCTPGDTSLWNGPYFYNTVIDNEASCPLELEIGDNNCPGGNEFLIRVEGYSGSSLGADLDIEKLELIIDHPWPPDLGIYLISPSGQKISVSEFNGNGTDDYGDASSDNCDQPGVFTDNACSSISEFEPPFVGEFKPETPLSFLYNGESPDGIWKLQICDRAISDLGVLRAARIVFSEEACILPQMFRLSDIGADNVLLEWDTNVNCQNLRISYKLKNAPVTETKVRFEECATGNFRILGLLADTEYEISAFAQCDNDSNSPISCVYTFRTACNNAMHLEDFDNLPDCQTVCDRPCSISGIWQNEAGDLSDWIVNEGPSLTEFTGPEADKNGTGKYIYIENQTNLCNEEGYIDLNSPCLTNPDTTSCQLSFYYHMYGEDTGSLSVQTATDNGQWNTVWSKSGDQGAVWQFASIAIDAFDVGRIRFRAFKTRDATRGDIAIDHIKLIGIDTISPPIYYRDADQDGYGDESDFIMACSIVAPAGFVINNEDCDDTNAEINPDTAEIPCNSIDENCNGPDDDVTAGDLVYVIDEKINESCAGASNGSITINITNGIPPYEIHWNNAMTGHTVSNLSAGVYIASITDSNLCMTITDPIIIQSDQQLAYTVATAAPPTCDGIDDGRIVLLTGGTMLTPEIIWNNGLEGSVISGLAEGIYQATITDESGCQLITDEILLSGGRVITAGISMKRHVACHGEANGFLQLGVSGGIPPYNIQWSNSETGFVNDELPAGIYSVTVNDQQGCREVLENIKIDDPDPLIIELSNIEHVGCPGGNNSFVDIRIEGGTPPYSYIWSNNMHSQDIFNVGAGAYSITVTDFNACSATRDDIVILEPDPINILLDSITTVECKSSNDGFVRVEVAGGNPPYGYNWSIDDGQLRNEPFLENLLPGSYQLTVVDDYGCKSRSFTFNIENQNIPINISLNQINGILCFSDSTASIAAVSDEDRFPLDFNWSNGKKTVKSMRADTIINLPADSYNVTITDNEGCVGISDSIRISQPAELRFTLTEKKDNPCAGDEDGLIEVKVNGGIPPYEIMWNNGMSGSRITELPEGLYRMTITDANDCESVSQNIEISSPSELSLEAEIIHPNNGNNGSIILHSSGGTGPYQYSWADPLSSLEDSIATGLSPGEYSVTLTDARGCMKDSAYILEYTDAVSEPEDDKGVSIYPVPAASSGYINYRLNSRDFEKAELLNISGELVLTKELPAGSDSGMIELENIPEGIYIICFSSPQSIICQRLIILKIF